MCAIRDAAEADNRERSTEHDQSDDDGDRDRIHVSEAIVPFVCWRPTSPRFALTVSNGDRPWVETDNLLQHSAMFRN